MSVWTERARSREAILAGDAEAYCSYRQDAKVALPLEGVDSARRLLAPSGYVSLSGPRPTRHLMMLLTVRDAILEGRHVVVVTPFAGHQRWLADLARVVGNRSAWAVRPWTLQVFAAGAEVNDILDALSAPVDLVIVDGVERLSQPLCLQLLGAPFDAPSANPHDALVVLARRTDAVVIGCVDDQASQPPLDRLGSVDRTIVIQDRPESLEIDITTVVSSLERTDRFRQRGTQAWTSIELDTVNEGEA